MITLTCPCGDKFQTQGTNDVPFPVAPALGDLLLKEFLELHDWWHEHHNHKEPGTVSKMCDFAEPHNSHMWTSRGMMRKVLCRGVLRSQTVEPKHMDRSCNIANAHESHVWNSIEEGKVLCPGVSG